MFSGHVWAVRYASAVAVSAPALSCGWTSVSKSCRTAASASAHAACSSLRSSFSRAWYASAAASRTVAGSRDSASSSATTPRV
eukprot:scaffold15055_cov121-Isochrysis_galbana.AAC.7